MADDGGVPMTQGTDGLLLFGAALALLLGGHVVRLARWSLLMRQIGHPRLGEGFMALSLAYLINAVVQLRLGEIARGVYYARRMKADTAFVLASIIAERTLDLVAVWAVTMVLLAAGVFGDVPVLTETLLTLGTAAVLLAVAPFLLTHLAGTAYQVTLGRAKDVEVGGSRSETLRDLVWLPNPVERAWIPDGASPEEAARWQATPRWTSPRPF